MRFRFRFDKYVSGDRVEEMQKWTVMETDDRIARKPGPIKNREKNML